MGALFLLGSLMFTLAEIDGDNRRIGGLVACLLFQALGVGLMILTRGRASTTAGAALTALAVIPLVVYLFVDVNDPSNTIESTSDFTNTATISLLAAAALWLLAYLFGPGRRYGVYLGGALLAVWLIAVVQIVDGPLDQAFSPFETTQRFQAVGESIGSSDPSFTDEYYGAEYYEDDFFAGTDSFSDDSFAQEDFDSEFDSNFTYEYDDYGYQDLPDYQDLPNPATKLGWASLLFGAAYLAFTVGLDRRGDDRTGTPFAAVSAPILLVAISFLSDSFGESGTYLLAVAIGVAQGLVGVRGGRRFTAWLGMLVAAFGVFGLVAEAAGDSTKVIIVVLLVLGVSATLLGLAFDGGLSFDGQDGSGGPPEPGFPGAPPAGPPAYGGQPSTPPAWTPPTGPAGDQPASGGQPGGLTPPTLQSPPAPWSSPGTDDPTLWAPPPQEPPPAR